MIRKIIIYIETGIHDYSKIISVVATTFKLFFRFTKKKKEKERREEQI